MPPNRCRRRLRPGGHPPEKEILVRRALALLFLAALVGACAAPPPGTRYETTLVLPDGTTPLPIVLGDVTGLVTAIEPGAQTGFGVWEGEVKVDPSEPKVLQLSWMAGVCEN